MRTIRRGEGSDTRAEVRDLRARLAKLEAQLGDEPSAEEATDERGPVSRRRLLGLAGAAAAGAAGAMVAGATPAGATDPNDVVLGVDGQDSGANTTGLTSSNGQRTFHSVSTAGGGNGIEGVATGGIGAVGSSGSGIGVYGASGSDNSLAAAAPGSQPQGAHLRLEPATLAGPPASGLHSVGQFWSDLNGVLFYCVVGGNPGLFVRQTSLVTLDAPFRIYDSRASQPNPSGSIQGTLDVGGGARVINCTPTPNIAGVNLSNRTTAILFNVTLANMVGSVGSVVVWANGATEPTTSSINWSAGQATIANAVTSACDASQDVQIKCTTGVSTNVIMDVIGFYI